MQGDLVIYDALSITSKIHSPAEIVVLLGLESVSWQCAKGAKGYRQRMYWETISIHFDGADDQGVWLEMMGQGCRCFETYGNGDYQALFRLVLEHEGEMKITRLDVAFDDHTGILDMPTLIEDTKNQEFISRWNDWQVIFGSKGSSVTHGSMASEIYLRIYDKAAERGLTDGSHWIRVELQLRRDRAKQFISEVSSLCKEGGVGEIFAGVLVNYVRYVDEDIGDSNRWRWPLKLYWAALLGAASALRLFVKPGVDYNFSNLENFVVKNCGNAIDAYIQLRGPEAFLDDIKHRGTMPNPKYQEIIERWKRGEV